MKDDAGYWAEVEALFHELADENEESRAARLSEVCAGRDDLRREVESLLESNRRLASFMNPSSESGEESFIPSLGPGDRVGAFRLIEEVGSGGMATVYRSERADGEFEHRVAVKLMSMPLADSTADRRFKLERQILASLRHPNVVTLLDGGVASDGRGYLAMEFVEGVPLTTYSESQSLSLGERLTLFREVCSGVQYAHRHGVVHRDLKPANILITAEGTPKVLDFGIAKLTQVEASDVQRTTTAFGLGPMTPAYASPEQLRGLPVTTSSDIYSLGVILYELVSGGRPYEVADKTLEEILHTVVDEEPMRPSSQASRSGRSLPYDAQRRLRGDLDAIVLKAMAKEPEERYGSAEELSADVARFLRAQPVEARPPSLGYVIRKLAARHKTAFATVSISMVAILAAMFLALWQARVANLERERAERRFAEVRQLANTLIFDIHDAVTPLAGSTPVRETIVSEGLQYLESLAPEAETDPALQEELARAYGQIGRIQGFPSVPNLGDRQAAIDSFQRAVSLLRPLATSEDVAPETVVGFVDILGNLSITLSAIDAREPAIQAALESVESSASLFERRPEDEEAKSLWARANFMAALTLGYPESLPYWRASEAIYERLLGEKPDDMSRARNVALVHKYLGSYFDTSEDHDQALHHHRRALDLDQTRLALNPESRMVRADVGISLASVAYVHLQRGELQQSAELYRQSLEHRTAIAESDPQDILARGRLAYVHMMLGQVFERLGDLDQAWSHAETSTSLYTAITDRSQATMTTQALLLWSRLHGLRGLHDEACRIAEEALLLLTGMSQQTRLSATSRFEEHRDSLFSLAGHCGDGPARAREWRLALESEPTEAR